MCALVAKCQHETMSFQPQYLRSQVSSYCFKVTFSPPSSLSLPISQKSLSLFHSSSGHTLSLSLSHQGAQSAFALRFKPHPTSHHSKNRVPEGNNAGSQVVAENDYKICKTPLMWKGLNICWAFSFFSFFYCGFIRIVLSLLR